MKKLFFIIVSFFLFMFLFAGCSDDEDTTPANGDESRIYHQKFDFEDLCFDDILLVYDLNDNNINDFWNPTYQKNRRTG